MVVHPIRDRRNSRHKSEGGAKIFEKEVATNAVAFGIVAPVQESRQQFRTLGLGKSLNRITHCKPPPRGPKPR